MFRFAPRAFLPFVLAIALGFVGLAAVRAQVFDSKSAGHAGLYREETIENANKLIERMKEDTEIKEGDAVVTPGKTLVIETFLKPEWVDPQWPPRDAKDKDAAQPRDPVREVKVMNAPTGTSIFTAGPRNGRGNSMSMGFTS